MMTKYRTSFNAKKISRRLVKIVGLAAICAALPLLAQVRINEVMPSNTTIIADEDGDYPDWIELTNTGINAVNLGNMGLTDDESDPFKWELPSIQLAPEQHVLIFASDKNRAISHWETVVDVGAVWRYQVENSNTPANWILPEYYDGNWSSGPSGFGYGDGDDATLISPTISIYARIHFVVEDLSQIDAALLHIDYDDGFVAYLNGQEIARANIGEPGIQPGYNETTHSDHERTSVPDLFVIDEALSLLREGDNVLAVQGHNYGLNSSDMSLIPVFTLGMKSPPANAKGTSAWITLPGSSLHTNFKIKSAETICVTNVDGTLLDSLTVKTLPSDYSIGRYPDGHGEWQIFGHPTPGEPNSIPGYTGMLSEPQFSPTNGFYPGPVKIVLTAAEPDVKIRYTMDGSEPVSTSPVFESAISVSKTTVIRARSFAEGVLPSQIITRTYIIGENFTLPTLSITISPADLWDPDSGIYVLGRSYDQNMPNWGANFWEGWEKPAHVEFFEADGVPGFRADAGTRIFGGWSRARAQKSMSFFFRGEYGMSELDYPLFPEQPFKTYQAFNLRNSANDWDYTFFRDGMMETLIAPLDLEIQAYRPCVAFMNGEYWGILNLREKQNEHYIASHYDVDPDNIDMLEANSSVIHGDNAHYLHMLDYITENDVRQAYVYEQVQQWMDVDNYMDYMIANIYFDNRDWPGNNIKYWRPRTPEGRWRWIVYDTDWGFGINAYGAARNSHGYDYNTLAYALSPTNTPNHHGNPPWSTFLLRRLMENTEFRNAFINRSADLFNSIFKPDHVASHIDSIASLIEPEIERHFEKWRQAHWWQPDSRLWWESLDSWYWNVQVVQEFGQKRIPYMQAYMLRQFDLPGVSFITVDVQPENAGDVTINRLKLQQFPWQGHYFQQVPVPIVAQPRSGYRFLGWQGFIESDSAAIQVELSHNTSLIAVFEKNNNPSASVVINEINYNSAPTNDCEDWIELYNNQPADVDMSGWILGDNNDQHTFVIPAGTTLRANNYLVIARDTTAFQTCYPTVQNTIGEFTFGLSSHNDAVRLFDRNGTLVDSVSYTSSNPWPAEANGTGSTLELREPSLDNCDPGNWHASRSFGTPGAPNSAGQSTWLAQKSGHPSSTQLIGNYPNPFNPITTIEYELSEPGHVELQVFDVTGRLVASLAKGVQKAGIHQFEWDASQQASGVYIVRMQAGENIQFSKMLVVR